MTKTDLANLIETCTTDIINKNIDYIAEQHSKELNEVINNGDLQEIISQAFRSYLHTAINLSTLNTINILEQLNVLSLPEEK